jgi:hypothetical protein
MLHGLYWLAANVAFDRPTLLAIDDLYWADTPSLQWLVYLTRRLEGVPLLVPGEGVGGDASSAGRRRATPVNRQRSWGSSSSLRSTMARVPATAALLGTLTSRCSPLVLTSNEPVIRVRLAS